MNNLLIHTPRNLMKPLNEHIAVLALFVIVAGPYYITTSPLLHHNHVKRKTLESRVCALTKKLKSIVSSWPFNKETQYT